MAESGRRGLTPSLERRVGLVIGRLAMGLALVGGLVLVALAVLTVVSVTGRTLVWLGLGPVPGDFELVETGCVFAVFSFLPWCQLRRGHVTVDVFVARIGRHGLAWLSLTGNALLTICALLIAWRLQAGLADKLSYGETTFILQMPVWYGYAAAIVGAWLFALTGAYTTWRSLNEALNEGETPV